MKKRYQKDKQEAVERIEAWTAEQGKAVKLSLPRGEVAKLAQQSLGELMRRVGKLLIETVMEEEVEELVGERSKPNQQRQAYRWGSESGYCIVDGQRVPIDRPRVRSRVHNREIPLGSYALFQKASLVEETVWHKIMYGLSMRHYKEVVKQFSDAYGLEKSTTSEHFVAASRNKLAELMQRSLEHVSLAAIVIDGTIFQGEHLIVALGIERTGRKLVLGLRQGAVENKTVVEGLLGELAERGVDFNQPRLYLVDGSKAIRSAIVNYAGEAAFIQRCQVHIAGRNPRIPEGWKVPSRARPCEPGSLGSGMARRLAMSKQTRHVASEPSPEARANVQAVPQGNVWRRHGSPNGNHWESSETGWSSLLCMGEDSNGCGCVGKRSSRRPRRFEQRHERKVA